MSEMENGRIIRCPAALGNRWMVAGAVGALQNARFDYKAPMGLV